VVGGGDEAERDGGRVTGISAEFRLGWAIIHCDDCSMRGEGGRIAFGEGERHGRLAEPSPQPSPGLPGEGVRGGNGAVRGSDARIVLKRFVSK